MKIYERVVLDMNGQVLEEESYEYDGPLELCGGGGGGSTGSVAYPSFIETAWKDFYDDTGGDSLTESLISILEAATNGGNPFTGETSFDPNAALTLVANSPLDTMQDEHDAAVAVVSALAEQTDWDAIITKAFTEVDTQLTDPSSSIDTVVASVVSKALANATSLMTAAVTAATSAATSSSLDSAVAAYTNAQKAEFLSGVGRWAAGMAEANAAEGSAYVIGLGLIEARFLAQISEYRQQLGQQGYQVALQQYIDAYNKNLALHLDAYVRSWLQYRQNRIQTILQGSQQMAAFLSEKVSHYKDLVRLQAEISRMTIVALKEKKDAQLAIDSKDGEWELDQFVKAGNIFAQIAGGTAGPVVPKDSALSTALGGAMSGAATGAAIGSVVPGLGTAAGAIVGGTLGLLGGLF